MVPVTLAEYIERHGVNEAARRLKIPRMTLYRWRTGQFSPHPLYRRLLSAKGITVPSPTRKP